MKKFLIAVLIASSISSGVVLAQVPGKKITGPITILDTVQINNGDIIYIGEGSNSDKKFAYYFEPRVLDGMHMAGTNMADDKLTIIGLRVDDDADLGRRYYAVVRPRGEITNWGIDLANAIKHGEITGINNIKFPQAKKAETVPPAQGKSSVADEIIKLKKLRDDGDITKEEYETLKRKLLDGDSKDTKAPAKKD